MKAKSTLLGLWAIGLWVTGCGRPAETAKPEAAAPLPAATVRTQKVEAKKHMVTEEVVGTVRAKLRASIEAKVSGRIMQMSPIAGQKVKAGEFLAELDVKEIQARLDQAQALREEASRNLKRYTQLLNEKAIPQQEFESVEARFQVAEAAVKEAATMLGYAKITAPFDGVIVRKLADVGDLAAPGRGLLELEDPSLLQFVADVPEGLLDRVQLGAKMPVKLSMPAAALEGVVSEIDPMGDPNSRTFKVKLDLPPQSGARSGLFGRVVVPVSEGTALRVPASAVVLRGQMEMVFVAVSGKVQLRLVKTGKHFGDEIELVSGVQPGEEVVSDSAGQLVDGQAIK